MKAEKVRLAFLGFRHNHIMGFYHAARSHPQVEVVAAAEDHEPTIQSLKRDGKVALTHSDWREVIDRVPCDAIAVGDYFARRGEIIIAALEAGKHVIADKPICTRRDQLDTIATLAKAKSRVVSALLDLRDNGAFIAARRLIHENVIGKIHTVAVTAQHPLLLEKRPAWYFEPGKQGGTINDIAIHATDLIPWLTGRALAEVVAARVWNARLPQFPQFQDAAQFMLKLDNGGGVLGDVSYLAPDGVAYAMPQYWRVTIHGSEGAIEAKLGVQALQLTRRADRELQSIPVDANIENGRLSAFLREIRGECSEGALTTAEVLRQPVRPFDAGVGRRKSCECMPDLTPSIEESPSQSSLRSDLLPIVIAVTIFSAGSIWGAITSDGFLEADSLTHYLYARFAVLETYYFVNIWGRPLVTGLYALPAYFCGRMGVRVTSLLLALTCGFVAYAIARRQKYRWPVLALIFTLAQPLVFLHSFSELTELPFAALLGLAFLAYQRRRFFWMMVLIALSPLARPEGFGFLVVAAIALIAHRRWWWIPLLAVPLLVWDYAGWARYGWPDYATSLPHAMRWLLWLKQEWPYAPDSLYEHGTIFHFLMLMPAVVSPFIFPATCVGVWWCLRSFHKAATSGRRAGDGAPATTGGGFMTDICSVLIAVIPLLILAGHSFLYATGKMASSGEMRYMLIVAPFWGLLSAVGWTWIFERMNWRRHLWWAALAALLPVGINQRLQIGRVQLGYQVVPLHLNQDMITARRVARLYSQWPLHGEFPMMLASHPGVYYFLDISPTQKLQSREWTKSTIDAAPRGTILIWDPVFGVFNSDAKRSVTQQEIADAGWVPDEIGTDLINNADTPDDECWTVWLSPQTWSGGEVDPQIMTLGQVRLK